MLNTLFGHAVSSGVKASLCTMAHKALYIRAYFYCATLSLLHLPHHLPQYFFFFIRSTPDTLASLLFIKHIRQAFTSDCGTRGSLFLQHPCPRYSLEHLSHFHQVLVRIHTLERPITTTLFKNATCPSSSGILNPLSYHYIFFMTFTCF